jgi:hypothetical protein
MRTIFMRATPSVFVNETKYADNELESGRWRKFSSRVAVQPEQPRRSPDVWRDLLCG